MKLPVSWLKDYVDITLPIGELARRLTLAGLEVEAIEYVGWQMPEGRFEGRPGGHEGAETKISGISWEADKIVVAAVREVMPHPNADRLVLCRLFDGEQEHIVLTGAPNLYPYKGLGALDEPLKVPYAREGAHIFDGHQPGQVLTTLKRAKIRGVDSYSMICSEKELGISDDHEGVIILDGDAPVGVPLADYMGDAVLDINILPNVARAANVVGVAREVAALTGQTLRQPSYDFVAEGPAMQGRAMIEITNPALNPRFVLGLIEEISIHPSPYWMQRRLRLAGMRPINNIVDVTNYAMLEIGEPLHAFDYDVLVQRAGGKAPTIITRTAQAGERLTTLDGVERQLEAFTVLVCDTAGALSIAGVMGGAESEVSEGTRNVLLEGAAWNFINVRRTIASQKLQSEAAFRFSRGVHPAMAARGVSRGLELMRQVAGGAVCQGLVDNYPLPPVDPAVEITVDEVKRRLGIELSAEEIARILEALKFRPQIVSPSAAGSGITIRLQTPDHRLDIGEGVVGRADLLEEIARVYGYERVPATRLADELPPPHRNLKVEHEERLRDLLVELGLQEIVSYRLTTPERERRRLSPDSPPEDKPYIRLTNPIASDRVVMRHSLLSSALETVERNARTYPRQAFFEIGPVFMVSEANELPDELLRLVVVLTGPRALPGWQRTDDAPMDFYDLKGILDAAWEGMHIPGIRYEPAEHPSFHPGKCSRVWCGDVSLGVFGELHPLVRERFDLPAAPVLAADLDLERLLDLVPEYYGVPAVPAYPPVLEDLAIIVDEDLPAGRVEQVIREAGGKTLVELSLFDLYRGEQVVVGKKSLAYSLTYQASDRTLTDAEAGQIRQRIIHRLEQELGAKLRA